MDQDEITAQVYRVVKNNPTLPKARILDKIVQALPDVPMSRILISINHLMEG